MKLLLDMFLIFAKSGVMTFGGGYAMIPVLQRDLVIISLLVGMIKVFSGISVIQHAFGGIGVCGEL